MIERRRKVAGVSLVAAMQELLVEGSLPMIEFSTDDVGGVFERIAASGAEVLQEPADQPWGPRDFAFRDPSGNTLRITAQTNKSHG